MEVEEAAGGGADITQRRTLRKQKADIEEEMAGQRALNIGKQFSNMDARMRKAQLYRNKARAAQSLKGTNGICRAERDTKEKEKNLS